MRLLVDQNLPGNLAAQLADAGHDALHTSGVGLDRAEDTEIFAWCRANDRILLTADKKLTKFLADERATSPAVVVFRDYYEDKTTLVNDLVANIDTIATVVAGSGNVVVSLSPNRPMRVQILPLTGQ